MGAKLVGATVTVVGGGDSVEGMEWIFSSSQGVSKSKTEGFGGLVGGFVLPLIGRVVADDDVDWIRLGNLMLRMG